jgi:hypothetical protein
MLYKCRRRQLRVFWTVSAACGKNTGIKIKLFLYVCHHALRHKGIWGSGCIDPRFLDLGTSWRWMVSFTPRPLYLRGKSPRYPLDSWLGGPKNRPRRRGENSWLYRECNSDPSVVQPVASLYTDCAIEFRLYNRIKCQKSAKQKVCTLISMTPNPSLLQLNCWKLSYCDVSPESRDIGARIYGAAKHVSPTTNNNSWERCVTRELELL